MVSKSLLCASKAVQKNLKVGAPSESDARTSRLRAKSQGLYAIRVAFDIGCVALSNADSNR